MGRCFKNELFQTIETHNGSEKTQGALIKYRNDLAESNRAESYRKELDKIRRELDNTRSPDGIQTTEQLTARKKHLEEMIKNIRINFF